MDTVVPLQEEDTVLTERSVTKTVAVVAGVSAAPRKIRWTAAVGWARPCCTSAIARRHLPAKR